ncbi:hypothetical protein DFH94DRAFT_300446 [Russula ochroleuca]|uniref:Uncharacterized protein n=1 Tax=Russula ochroleuca TaxID=152965 RepID=A0A9P5ML77_9AGAM|nr:hypothetical protein DFH94DRAFT_85203 [Russula ochroleuca]KAF8467023.1 hypothetical protein DFH94DRAFT_300446 [Russula ochroleuca]
MDLVSSPSPQSPRLLSLCRHRCRRVVAVVLVTVSYSPSLSLSLSLSPPLPPPCRRIGCRQHHYPRPVLAIVITLFGLVLVLSTIALCRSPLPLLSVRLTVALASHFMLMPAPRIMLVLAPGRMQVRTACFSPPLGLVTLPRPNFTRSGESL